MKNELTSVAAIEGNPNWDLYTSRRIPLYNRDGDMRSDFARDYTRILHSNAYRRLKHKTQVFFNIDNDHICTRMEHVAHVESVSTTIANVLGLNPELTRAIAIGHDLGHAPFGHQGELVLDALCKEYLGKEFWHEANGLRFVDEIELLENNKNKLLNLDLTYAVRDGIISHCGEIDENGLVPRDPEFTIDMFDQKGKFQPLTWEGCVVKLSDKIAYVGRDIEDAQRLGFIDLEADVELKNLLQQKDVLNTTVIINDLVTDVCKNSSIENGINMSDTCRDNLKKIKDFNYKYIYGNNRFLAYKDYSELVIKSIFNILYKCYSRGNVFHELNHLKIWYPTLANSFMLYLSRYCFAKIIPLEYTQLCEETKRCQNTKIYKSLSSKKIYSQAIIDFISGMTDRFAVKVFNELITY